MKDLRRTEGDKKTLLAWRKSSFSSYLRIYRKEAGRRRKGKNS